MSDKVGEIEAKDGRIIYLQILLSHKVETKETPAREDQPSSGENQNDRQKKFVRKKRTTRRNTWLSWCADTQVAKAIHGWQIPEPH